MWREGNDLKKGQRMTVSGRKRTWTDGCFGSEVKVTERDHSLMSDVM